MARLETELGQQRLQKKGGSVEIFFVTNKHEIEGVRQDFPRQ